MLFCIQTDFCQEAALAVNVRVIFLASNLMVPRGSYENTSKCNSPNTSFLSDFLAQNGEGIKRKVSLILKLMVKFPFCLRFYVIYSR